MNRACTWLSSASSPWPKLLLSTIALVLCLAAIVAWPGGRDSFDLRVAMRSSLPGGVKLYYARPGETLAEGRSAYAPVIVGAYAVYTLHVPVPWNRGLRLRLDPIDTAGARVDILQVRIETRRGLRTVGYRVLPDGIDVEDGGVMTARKGGGFVLLAENSDVQLNVLPWKVARDSHLSAAAFVALALLLVALFLIYHRPVIADELAAAKFLIYALALTWLTLQGIFYAQKIPYGIPPDEHAHLSYLAHLKEAGTWLPDRSHRHYYDINGIPEPALNHLSHPPFYYDLLKPFVPSDPFWIIRDLPAIRIINLSLMLAGILLFAWMAGAQKLPLPFHLYVAVALATVPMFPYLGGAMNNDNLIFLAGAMAVMGALLFLADPPRPSGLLWMSAGLAMALAAKATSGLHVGIFVALVVAARVWRDRHLAGLRTWHAVIALLIVAGPVVYYLGLKYAYGSFTPFADGRGASGPKPHAVTLSLLGYTDFFLSLLGNTWAGILSHASVPKISWQERLPMLIPPLMAAAGLLWRSCPERESPEEGRFWRVMRLAGLATLLFMLYHFGMLYAGHRRTGFLGGIHARYYFSLIPAVLMLSYRPIRHVASRPLAVVLLAALMGGWLWSGLYYFLLVQFPSPPSF